MTISRVNLKAWDVSKLCNNQFGFIFSNLPPRILDTNLT
jgi:hypothetical protein